MIPPRRGWVHPLRKLSDAQVDTIRATSTPLREIARAMNVSHVTVRCARQRFTYKLRRS